MINSSGRNLISVQEGESLRVLTWAASGGGTRLQIGHDGAASTFYVTNTALFPSSLVFAGPIELTLISDGGRALFTFDLTTPSQPIDRTAVIPAGQAAQVTLESSSDLITWSATLPGPFTNNPSAKFFRIRMEKVP